MPWSKTNTISSMKNKSDALKQVFADAANSALAKGRSEEDAVFAGLAAVKIAEKKQEQTRKASEPLKQPLPSHVLAVIQKKLVEPSGESQSQDRNLISADFDKFNRLVLTFDNGDKIVSRQVEIKEMIEQYISVASPGPSNPFDYIDFNTASTAATEVARLKWNNVDGTLDLGMGGGQVTLQLGLEELVHVYNNNGVDFVDLNVIRVTGSQGLRVTASLAQANSELTSTTTFAVVTEPILKNQQGYATTRGIVRDVDTSAFTEGAQLYLSPTVPGGITQVKPVAPNHTVTIGWCVRSHHVNGMIYVSLQNGFELNELHNVKITNPLQGQILQYDQTNQIWVNVNSSTSQVSTEGEGAVQAKRTDIVDDSTMYQGEAAAGVLGSATGWRIKLITISLDGDMAITWASGNANYDKVWDNRLTYTYS